MAYAPLYWASVGAENTGRLAGCAACTQLVSPRPQAVAPQARFTRISDLAWRNCGPRLEEEPIQLRTLARHRPGISDRAEPLGWPPVPPALVTDPSTPAPWSVRAGIGLAGRPLHAAARRPAPPVPSRTPLRRSDRANARCSAASIDGVGECRPTFVTAKASDPLYPPRPLCASRVALACPRKPRGRACTTPIAPTCIALLPRRRSGLLRPTFVTVKASDTPYTQPGLCASRVPPARPRRCSACACAPGHAPIGRRCLVPLRRPDRSARETSCP